MIECDQVITSTATASMDLFIFKKFSDAELMGFDTCKLTTSIIKLGNPELLKMVLEKIEKRIIKYSSTWIGIVKIAIYNYGTAETVKIISDFTREKSMLLFIAVKENVVVRFANDDEINEIVKASF